MTDSDTKPPKVFISYAHESDDHAARVLAFADQLVRDGLDIILDQYNPVPKEGWPVWMQNGLTEADYVLLICSPTYYRRVMGKEAPGVGKGVRWEGKLIQESLHENNRQGDKYIPILLDGCVVADIPDIVRDYHRFPIAEFDFIDHGYEDLYRHLTGQPRVRRPARGNIRRFDAANVSQPAAVDLSGVIAAGQEAVRPARGPVIELPKAASVPTVARIPAKGDRVEDKPHPNPLLGKEREPEPTPNPSLKGRAASVISGELPPTRINQVDGAEMVLIPAGEFTMGSDNNRPDEKPAHQVYLDGFYMYKTPVTVAMYRKFCSTTGRAMPKAPSWGWDKDSYPMVNVSWNDAFAYARWAGVALPTEAQWEKAARGTDGRKYPWGNDWDPSMCRCSKKEVGDAKSPSPVGRYLGGASPYGVIDMAGNVSEWCSDWFWEDYYPNAPTRNPAGPEDGRVHVLRGGGWANDYVGVFRCAYRCRNFPGIVDDNVGFRCVSRSGS